jgi:quinol-cytochrome oxidoreductase complex cytochrome b subunit
VQKPTERPVGDRSRWPELSDQLIDGTTSVVLLLCVYSVLCIFLPAALGVRANLTEMPQGPKPEWYFLFLYQYVRLVPRLVGALTPAFLLVLLGAWPFLDRNPSRDPRARVMALALLAGLAIAILALTYFGWRG